MVTFIPDYVHQCHLDGKSVDRNGAADLLRAERVVKIDAGSTSELDPAVIGVDECL